MDEAECIKILEAANKFEPTSAAFQFDPHSLIFRSNETEVDELIALLTAMKRRNSQFPLVQFRKITPREVENWAVMLWKEFPRVN